MGSVIKGDQESKFDGQLLQQYELYVEMADRVSNRRAQTNRFYSSVLSLLLALPSFLIGVGVLSALQNIALLTVAILGLALSCLWYLNIRSYEKLNSAKFEVILEMEQHLTFASYTKEWRILKAKKYFRLTRVEQYVPLIFAIAYLLLFGFLYIWLE